MKKSSLNTEISVSVPVPMCIHVAQTNFENPFRLFLLLKLEYPNGKFKKNSANIHILANHLDVTDRTIRNLLKKLEKTDWIRLNSQTGYIIIRSFEKLRAEKNWDSRVSMPINMLKIINIRAVIGASIYGYLHKDFWRKVKRDKSVSIREDAYHFISPSFNYHNQPAPISVIALLKIFNLSIAKASRLKNIAKNAGYLKVVKRYSKIKRHMNHVPYLEKYDIVSTKAIINIRGIYHIQEIDLITPLFYFKKRKKLET